MSSMASPDYEGLKKDGRDARVTRGSGARGMWTKENEEFKEGDKTMCVRFIL